MRMIRIVVLIGIVACLPGAVYAAPGQLAFLPQVIHGSGALTLADCIDSSRSDPEIVKKYGGVIIEDRDGDGFIQPSWVLMRLSDAGADLNAITIDSTTDIRVVVDHSSQLSDRIQTAITDVIAKRKPGATANISMRLKRVPTSLLAHSSYESIKAEPIADTISDFPTQWIVTLLGKESETLVSDTVEIELSVSSKKIVAKRALAAGSEVSSSDFEEVSAEGVSPSENLYKNLSELGSNRFEVTEAIAQGEPVEKGKLRPKSTMAKGAVVGLIVAHDGFQVRALGRVKDVMDGGASVLVENIDSKKELVGMPISDTEVRIAY